MICRRLFIDGVVIETRVSLMNLEEMLNRTTRRPVVKKVCIITKMVFLLVIMISSAGFSTPASWTITSFFSTQAAAAETSPLSLRDALPAWQSSAA